MDKDQNALIFISAHGAKNLIFFENGDIMFSDQLQIILNLISTTEVSSVISTGFKNVLILLDSCKSG